MRSLNFTKAGLVRMACTVLSLFSGIGGLDLGFEMAGAKIVWASDICPIATASYRLNFGREATTADLNEVDIDSLPFADVIVGGPPCQSFSLVGKRKADDKRGALVYRFAEIVEKKLPTAFLMENVPGIVASRIDGERLTDVLVKRFADIGYSVEMFKLNAADYLVPQLRKRVFIAGCLKGKIGQPDPVEFARSSFGIDTRSYDNGVASAFSGLGAPVRKGQRARYVEGPLSKFAELMKGDSEEFSLHEIPRMSAKDSEFIKYIPQGGNYRDIPDEVATPRILKFKMTGGRTTTYARLHPMRPSYTVNTYFRRPNVGANFHPTEARLITIREAMRLQAIPDRFQIAQMGAQDSRNALIGNAVPPLLAYAVAREVLAAVEGRASLSERSRQFSLHF